MVRIGETDSTNRWLRELAGEHSEENIAVVADYQTDGHGCGSNSWESERGQNLLFSLLIHPTWLKASEQFLLSMAISNAIASVIEQLHPTARTSIKWPNDLYMDDRKVCGILIECRLAGNRIRDCIIGVGLNVNQRVFLSDAPNPTSLYNELRTRLNRSVLLDDILTNFGRMLERWDTADIAASYRSRLYRREGTHRYRDSNGLFSARLTAVENDGHLTLTDSEGRERRYAFKEVAFVI